MANIKLKIVMDEIKRTLEKHDVAGLVVLHTPGHSEYLLHINTTYSCAKLESGGIRIKALKSDYGGDTERRDRKVADTSNMLSLLGDTGAYISNSVKQISAAVDATVKAEHTNSKHEPGSNEYLN